MELKEFDYYLPKELIAQEPVIPRDHSRLMILKRKEEAIIHRKFYEIVDLVDENDILVFNNTKVVSARLYGKKEKSGGKVEIILIRPKNSDIFDFLNWPKEWLIIGKPSLKIGSKIIFDKDLKGEIREIKNYERIISFNLAGKELKEKILKLGLPPLPPYIVKPTEKSFLNYQTIFAKKEGSIAAPTASLHFTEELLGKIKAKGIAIHFVTLHIGLGTFLPIKTSTIENHKLHSEFFELDIKTANALNQAKKEGKRIIAVGTTVVRVLEYCALKDKKLKPQKGWTDLFIYPGFEFKIVDALITNFHLPKSSLLLLVCAFAGKDLIFRAYKEAIKEKYRFFSFGDAMFIV
ncbi:MAG: tRNA preQ1(34) S-adenosylmethionine ribosyltransferase-isomerase QueA [Minisyncoccia bacterium]